MDALLGTRGAYRGFEWSLTGTIVVFEGEAHPYKINLMKFDGKIRQVEPEVKTEILKKMSI